MRSTRNYFGLGLIIGVSVTALLMVVIMILGRAGVTHAAPPSSATAAAVVDIPTATPTAEILSPPASALPTFTPIPALTSPPNIAPGLDLVSSPTPDPIISALNAGDFVFSGPLPIVQQISLYRASLSYAQLTAKDSARVAKEINAVGYGDPTNICGPLAIAILRDAGVIASDISPHDFWLLNPVTTSDQRQLAHAFPPDRFSHSKVATALNKVDWQATPLEPGDFLFIWHGSGGNFDHMLVVSRVDRQQRAYAVTNFGTANGYIIAETLLYDPRDPKAGIFHTWTKERDAILGSTGFGGYEIWRALSPAAARDGLLSSVASSSLALFAHGL
jgi:hypothetical protein